MNTLICDHTLWSCGPMVVWSCGAVVRNQQQYRSASLSRAITRSTFMISLQLEPAGSSELTWSMLIVVV